MEKLRIGVVGLGSIAQRVYLPLLSCAKSWIFVGAFSPNQQKARLICDSYRIINFICIDELATQCDAVLVHSSTISHFQVVSKLLNLGMHVYVDKPLAETVAEAEELIALAKRRTRILMVGFNRRFAPLYRQMKKQMLQPVSLRMDKHRCDSIGPRDVRFTLLDDYLHLIDTALWLAKSESGGEAVTLLNSQLQMNDIGQLLYAEHYFHTDGGLITTSMHRKAGHQRERVQAVTTGTLYQVNDMCQYLREENDEVTEISTPAWQTISEQRGFNGALQHFIDSVHNQTMTETSGEQAIYAQRWIEQLLSTG